VLGLGQNRVQRAAERGRKSAPVEIDGGSVSDEHAKFEAESEIVDINVDSDVDVVAEAMDKRAEQVSVDSMAELDAGAKPNDDAPLGDPPSE